MPGGYRPRRNGSDRRPRACRSDTRSSQWQIGDKFVGLAIILTLSRIEKVTLPTCSLHSRVPICLVEAAALRVGGPLGPQNGCPRSGQLSNCQFIFALGCFGRIKGENRNGRGAKLTLDFGERSVLERAGPRADFPPNDAMPFRTGPVFSGFPVLSVRDCRDGKPRAASTRLVETRITWFRPNP